MFSLNNNPQNTNLINSKQKSQQQTLNQTIQKQKHNYSSTFDADCSLLSESSILNGLQNQNEQINFNHNPQNQLHQKQKSQKYDLGKLLQQMKENNLQCKLCQKKVLQLCVDPECESSSKSILCCINQSCKNYQKHQSCIFFNLKYAYKQLSNKSLIIKQVQDQIYNYFQELIDYFSQQRDKIIKKFKQQTFSKVFSSEELHFLDILLKKKNIEELDSNGANNLWKILKKNQGKQFKFDYIQRQFEEFRVKLEDEMKILHQNLQKGKNSKPFLKKQLQNQQQPKLTQRQIEQKLNQYEQVKQKHLKLFNAIKQLKGKMWCQGSILNNYYDSRAYFHVYNKRLCIDIYQSLQKLNLAQYE